MTTTTTKRRRSRWWIRCWARRFVFRDQHVGRFRGCLVRAQLVTKLVRQLFMYLYVVVSIFRMTSTRYDCYYILFMNSERVVYCGWINLRYIPLGLVGRLLLVRRLLTWRDQQKMGLEFYGQCCLLFQENRNIQSFGLYAVRKKKLLEHPVLVTYISKLAQSCTNQSPINHKTKSRPAPSQCHYIIHNFGLLHPIDSTSYSTSNTGWYWMLVGGGGWNHTWTVILQ